MTQVERFHRPALLGLLVLAAIIRLAVAWQPVEELVTRTMPDDAFYYLQIARHIAGGSGVTFDGVELANGFHPLWMILLLPIYALAGADGELGIHLALTLASLIDVATIALIAVAARAITRSAVAGLVAGGWYALNPGAIIQVVNGLETSVNVFCLAALFAFAVSERERETLGRRQWLLFGLLSGVCMLARMDNVVPVVIVGLGLVTFPLRPERIRGLVTAAALSAVIVGPWLWWNAVHTGSIIPTSANAYGIVTRARMDTATVIGNAVRDTVVLFSKTIPSDVAGKSHAVLFITGALAAGFAWPWARGVRGSVRRLLLPLLACVTLLLTHSLIRGTVKVWYIAPAALILAYGVGIAGHLLLEREAPRTLRLGASAVVTAVMAVGFVSTGRAYTMHELMPWQRELVDAGEWLKNRSEPPPAVGAFNAGILAYVSEAPVVNLDGLVNVSAADAVKERALGAYIAGRDIRLLIDFEYSLFEDYEPFYGNGWNPRANLREVESFAQPGRAWANTHVGAYRVVSPAVN